MLSLMLGALVNLSHPGHYLHWGFVQMSVANFVVIVLMVVVFAATLVIPFEPAGATGERRHRRRSGCGPPVPVGPGDGVSPAPGDERMWSARLRGAAMRALPPGKLLPDRQPSYVASWVYIFGVLSLAYFVVILISGVVLVLKGPSWWHLSKTGLFFNSIHLWSVELFFFFMVLHLWGKFFMAAWRGNRALTWMTGVVCFVLSIATAFTGYLSQQNFDSQWISTQAKDGINPTGAGAFFNVLNFGQMLLWHVLLLPIAVGALIGLHLLMVRHRDVVRPLPARAGRHSRSGPARALPPRRALRGPTDERAPPPDTGHHHLDRGHAPARPQRLERAQDPLRPGQGIRHRPGGDGAAGRGAGRGVLLARRPPRHHPAMGPGRPRRLPGHGGHRAGRDEPDGHLRPALQLLGPGRRPEARSHRPRALGRGRHPGQQRGGLRPVPVAPGRHQRRPPARRPDHLRRRHPGA